MARDKTLIQLKFFIAAIYLILHRVNATNKRLIRTW